MAERGDVAYAFVGAIVMGMKRALVTVLCLLATALACRITPDYGRVLPPGAPTLIPLGRRESVPNFAGDWAHRAEIEASLARSLEWMQRRHAKNSFPIAGITYQRARASLLRFAEVLASSYGPTEFQATIEAEFTLYKSAGWDGRGGGVLFTAYCTPVLRGKLRQDAAYRYPLFALPDDLIKDASGRTTGWKTAFGIMPTYPARGAIEGAGLLAGRSLELAWLANPIDAYLAHVNGSAFIELPDRSMLRLGYAGKNGRSYVSLGRELEDDGIIPRGQASLATIRAWAADARPQELNEYLHRNQSYVFFTLIDGNPHGSLDVEVTGGRSLATDRTIFPPGALVFVDTEVASLGGRAEPFQRFLFDQDTGGAIQTAGRADIYLGIGHEAEELAGKTKATGQLYYLFLKE